MTVKQDNQPQGAMAAAISAAKGQQERRDDAPRQEARQEARQEREVRQERDPQFNQFLSGSQGLIGVRSYIAPPTAYRSGGDLSGKIRAVLDEMLKKDGTDPNYLVELHHIPKGEPFGNVSPALASVIVALRARQAPDAAVAYYTLIVEASGDGFKTQHLPVPGAAPIDISITPDMIFDENFESAVAQFIERRYPAVPVGMQLSAQGMVLPRFAGDITPESLAPAFNEALAATSSTLVTAASGEEDYSLPQQNEQRQTIVQERYNMLATTALDGEWMGTDGRPRRMDLRLELKTGRPYQDNRYGQAQLSQNLETSTTLGWLGAGLEFFHVPLPQSAYYQPSSQFQFQPEGDSRIAQFYARYVVTWLQTQEIPTLSRLLFILAMADSLRAPMNWYNLIRSTMRSQDAVAARDIGLLGLIAQGYPNAGNALDLPSSNEEEIKLQQWLAEVFHKLPVISMDIDLCGPNTWFMRDFADASKLAEGFSDLAAQANDKILGAGMVLTNGAIADFGFAPGTEPVCFPELTLVPAGTIQTNSGLRDVRNVDLLNILGTQDARRDPSLAMRFNDTFFPEHESQRDRCHATRLQLIKQFYPSFKHTGWHFRVTLNPNFIGALAGSIARNNVSITQTDDAEAYQGWAERQYRYADQYAGRYQASGLYQRGGYAPGGNNRGQTPYRW